MSYQPPFPPGGQRPRSTPIPGDAPFRSPIEDAPLTPAEYLGAPTPTDLAPPMRGAGPVPAPAVDLTPQRRTRRSGAPTLIMMFMVVVIVGGVGAAVWGVMKAKEKVNEATSTANDYSDPLLSDRDRSELGLVGAEEYLWEGDAPAAVAAAFDSAIFGDATRFTEINLYTDYAFATALDPSIPERLDRYGWRAGAVGLPEPQQNDAEATVKGFTVDEMDWTALATAAADAPRLLNVEDGAITLVSITRDVFDDAMPLVARIYVTGPRSSGFVVVAADGTIVETF